MTLSLFFNRNNFAAIPFYVRTFFVLQFNFSLHVCWRKRIVPDKCSHRSCSVKKGVLKNFAKFTRKHLCQSLFFNKVADLRPATLLKKRLWHSCFPVDFAKFLKAPFLQNTSGRLLLFIGRYGAADYKMMQIHKFSKEFTIE